ncbi:DUF2570 domain-containing protein [Klebsiella pneumoniae]|uniref:DUF2570 domain-containing protein n=1 Tax=Klebsiella pneumoniae TaxID=573 RepID=UPI00396575B9
MVVLIGALAISASHYKGKAEQERQRADGAEQQVNAAKTITSNVLTTMTIFNTIVEANQHAKEQIALDASGASADIRVAVANDDCTNRPVPAGAVKRLQQFAFTISSPRPGRSLPWRILQIVFLVSPSPPPSKTS